MKSKKVKRNIEKRKEYSITLEGGASEFLKTKILRLPEKKSDTC